MRLGLTGRIVAATLLSLLCALGFGAGPKQGTSVLKGLVTIQTPGGPAGPVAGVAVTATGPTNQTTTTDASGHYTLQHLLAGNYKVQFQKAGFLVSLLKKFVLADNTTAYINAGLTPVLSATEIAASPESSEHLWTIHNPNAFSVSYTWFIKQKNMSGAGTALPGVSTLDSGVYGNASHIQLFVNGFSVQPLSKTIPSPVPAPGSIAGTVSDNNSNPLQGASVTLLDNFNTVVGTDTSDVDGAYSFESLAPGTYTVGVSLAGFNPFSATVSVSSNSTTPLDVTLSPIVVTGTLAGTVTDSNSGLPLSNALVSLQDTGGNPIASASTQADGTYSIGNILNGSYNVTFADTGYTSRTFPVTITAGATTTQNASLVFNLPPPTCNVQVSVKSAADSSMMPGVSVQITYSGNATVATGITDATGSVSFTGQPVGSTATVIANLVVSGQNLGQTGQLVTGGFVTGDNGVQLLMASGRVGGVVADQQNASLLSGAQIQLLDSNNVLRATAFSGPDGSFVTPGVTPGMYTVVVTMDNYMTYTVSNVAVVSGQETQLGVSLGEDLGSVSGTITDSISGTGIVGLTLTASGAGGSYNTGTDSLGHFQLTGIPFGNYTVTVNGASYRGQPYPNNSTSVFVPGNGNADASMVLQDSNGVIEGTVTSTFDGTAIAGAGVTVNDPGKPIHRYGSTSTDANGHYVLVNIPNGSYMFGCGASNFTGVNLSMSTSGSVTSFDVALKRVWGGLSGIVRDQNGVGLANVQIQVRDSLGNLVLNGASNPAVKGLQQGSFGYSDFMDPAVNPFTVTFSYPGYQPQTFTVNADYGVTATINVSLVPLPPPTAEVDVTVVDGNGVPSTGASVTILYNDGSSSGPLPTDANGNVVFTSQEVGDGATIQVVSADGTQAGSFAVPAGFVDGVNPLTVTIG